MCSGHCADIHRGIWPRDKELSDVAGTEVLAVAFQGSYHLPREGVSSTCGSSTMPVGSPGACSDFFLIG